MAGGITLTGGFAAGGVKTVSLLRAVVSKVAHDVLADAVNEIQTGAATGETYKRGGVAHRASAPGEAPASDTGNLAASGSVEDSSDGSISSAVVFSAEYAAGLEFGTVHIAPRPFLLPAVERARDGFEAAVVAAAGKYK